MTQTITPPEQTQPAPAPRRKRPAKVRRAVVGTLVTLGLTLGGVTAWALNRYVIDHVEVSDVAAYEAEQAASSSDEQDTATSSEATTANEDSAATDTATQAAAATSEPQITITSGTYGTGEDAATYYVADIVVSDISQLRAGLAQNQFGTNITEDPSDIAASLGALVAINGDYYGFRSTGIVIRNGVLYRDDGARTGAVIYADGTMEVYDETTTTGEELLANGAWQTLSFGPALIDDGVILEGIDEIEIDTNVGNRSIQGNQPRTAIGMISANHYVFVVVDGRSDSSAGVTMTELAEILASLGATEAYNLDGGGSATMVDSDGSLVNTPSNNGERATSDILYIAASA